MYVLKYLCRGALTGLLVGTFVGAALLLVGRLDPGSEAMEGATLTAYMLSLPVSLLCQLFDYGIPADHWQQFIVLAPATNGLFLGTAVGGIVAVFRSSRSEPSA